MVHSVLTWCATLNSSLLSSHLLSLSPLLTDLSTLPWPCQACPCSWLFHILFHLPWNFFHSVSTWLLSDFDMKVTALHKLEHQPPHDSPSPILCFIFSLLLLFLLYQHHSIFKEDGFFNHLSPSLEEKLYDNTDYALPCSSSALCICNST